MRQFCCNCIVSHYNPFQVCSRVKKCMRYFIAISPHLHLYRAVIKSTTVGSHKIVTHEQFEHWQFEWVKCSFDEDVKLRFFSWIILRTNFCIIKSLFNVEHLQCLSWRKCIDFWYLFIIISVSSSGIKRRSISRVIMSNKCTKLWAEGWVSHKWFC